MQNSIFKHPYFYFFKFAIVLSIFALIGFGCGGGGGDGGGGGGGGDGTINPGVDISTIDFAPYSAADFAANPEGGGFIVAGHLIIDFADTLSITDIDAILDANDMKRVGWISGVNLVTAKILDGRDESEAKDAIKSLDGVESTVLNILLEPNFSAGSLKPILKNPGADPGPYLSLSELALNWPHYVMETFPALALADKVLGSSATTSVVLAILDTGGFQLPTSTGTDPVLDKPKLSLLSGQTQDTDLAPKVVAPTGIEVNYDPQTGRHSAELRIGTVDSSSNHLIGAGIANDDTTALHGLAVASAAVGNGQDILGTGRHVNFRPIKISVNGYCTEDATTVCESDFDCALDGKGSCAMGFCSEDINTPCMGEKDDQCKAASKGECKTTLELVPTDWFLASLARVAEDANNAGINDSRVLNISMGYPKDLIMSNAEIDTAANILRPLLENYISDNRIVVISAGNEADNTTNRMLAALGPVRGIDRNAAGTALINRGTMVVSATAFFDIIYPDETTMENFPAWFSNYGPNVSVSAPGESVPVLKGDLEHWDLKDGTSFSAPYVAGLAAEMFALDEKATNAEIASIIEKTADGIETQKPNDYIGYGRINAWKAILTLLNRKSPVNEPEWLGFRYRSVVTLPPDQVRINNSEIPEADRLVPDIYVKRVFNITQDMEDNSREVPSEIANNFQMATQFSVETADLENTSGDVVLLEFLDEGGAIVYQVPAVLDDLLNLRPLDTSIDDYVITFDIVTDTAAIYGQVTSKGKPVSGVTITYTDINESQKQITTESSGVYVIYDAKPDSEFEIRASKDGLIGDAYDITAPKFRATRQDFLLGGAEFPMNYDGEYTTTYSAGSTDKGDCRLYLYENGSATYTYLKEGNTFWYSVYGKHKNGGFTIEFPSGFKIEGTYNTDSMSGSGSNSGASMTVWGNRVK